MWEVSEDILCTESIDIRRHQEHDKESCDPVEYDEISFYDEPNILSTGKEVGKNGRDLELTNATFVENHSLRLVIYAPTS